MPPTEKDAPSSCIFPGPQQRQCSAEFASDCFWNHSWAAARVILATLFRSARKKDGESKPDKSPVCLMIWSSPCRNCLLSSVSMGSFAWRDSRKATDITGENLAIITAASRFRPPRVATWPKGPSSGVWRDLQRTIWFCLREWHAAWFCESAGTSRSSAY